MTTLTTLDATSLLGCQLFRRVRRPTILLLSEHTYSPKEASEESWLPPALSAFTRLAATIHPRRVLVVGTGSGLDALSAIEAFEPELVDVTDLLAENVDVALRNIAGNLHDPCGTRVAGYAGDLLTCIPGDARYGFVYENLPNLPAPAGLELRDDVNAASFHRDEGELVPQRFRDHLLTLHHRCLEQARPHILPGGGILTSIGGRVPLELVYDLHRSLGYEPELVVFAAKLQTEPDEVLAAYAETEARLGLTFRYLAPEFCAVLDRARRAGVEGEELADVMAADLDRLSMTATEALARHRRGERVAHTVFMVFGRHGGTDRPGQALGRPS